MTTSILFSAFCPSRAVVGARPSVLRALNVTISILDNFNEYDLSRALDRFNNPFKPFGIASPRPYPHVQICQPQTLSDVTQ